MRSGRDTALFSTPPADTATRRRPGGRRPKRTGFPGEPKSERPQTCGQGRRDLRDASTGPQNKGTRSRLRIADQGPAVVGRKRLGAPSSTGSRQPRQADPGQQTLRRDPAPVGRRWPFADAATTAQSRTPCSSRWSAQRPWCARFARDAVHARPTTSGCRPLTRPVTWHEQRPTRPGSLNDAVPGRRRSSRPEENSARDQLSAADCWTWCRSSPEQLPPGSGRRAALPWKSAPGRVRGLGLPCPT